MTENPDACAPDLKLIFHRHTSQQSDTAAHPHHNEGFSMHLKDRDKFPEKKQSGASEVHRQPLQTTYWDRHMFSAMQQGQQDDSYKRNTHTHTHTQNESEPGHRDK